jgi:CDP-diacylglycerol--serine O-phosphatidyltransferase
MFKMKNLPNLITCLNLYAGCLSCVMALVYGNYIGAFIFILLAACFDFLDGFTARLIKAHSPIGAQLDSLADVVSFGMAPGFIVYSFLSASSDAVPFAANIPFLAFLIPIFAALRLAKFNVDKRQKSSFLGLPVPANGLFWATLIPSIPLSGSNHAFSTFFVVTLIIIFSFQGHVILKNPLHIVLIAVPLVIQTFLIFFIAYGASKVLKLLHDVAAPAAMIGASNFFELAVAVAIALFGTQSPVALATIVGVLVEVPVMLVLVWIANNTKGWFKV